MATQLADYRYDFPLEDRGKKKRRAAKVEITGEGMFKIYYPKEVIQWFGLKTEYAFARSLGEATGSFERQIEDYRNAVQTANREKVIVVTYLYNMPYADGGFGGTYQLGRSGYTSAHDDHIGKYGLSLDYEVVWKIGDSLYMVPIDGDEKTGRVYGAPHHLYRLPLDQNKGKYLLPWTEEHEQFFSNMVMGLESMTARLNKFFGDDLLANMTKAIAAGGGFASLPAPEKKA